MRAFAVLFLLFILSACHKPAATPAGSHLSAADIGKLIFHDVSLSASGKQSCASCHSPQHAHAQPNALAVQFGGPLLNLPGTRAVPSVRYLADTPPLGFDDEGTPVGGFNHDGSVDTLAAQAERPLLAANEMANLTREAVVEKLRKADYAAKFRQVLVKQVWIRWIRHSPRWGWLWSAISVIRLNFSLSVHGTTPTWRVRLS